MLSVVRPVCCLAIVSIFLGGIFVTPSVDAFQTHEAEKGATKSSDELSIGISRTRPTEGRSVDLGDGRYMVPYTTTIPGTDIEFSMEPIPGGVFTMGRDDGQPDEQPAFEVKVEPFWMAKYEVTWAEFRRYMEFDQGFKSLTYVRPITDENRIDAVTAPSPLYDPDHIYEAGDDDNEPAAAVSQFGAKQYTKWLSLSIGDVFYRLPMEYEWEYACRAGTNTRFYFGDDETKLKEHANIKEDFRMEVGQMAPNPWGLHDMYGNVAEWVLDQYSPQGYQQAKKADGKCLKGDEAYLRPTQLYPRLVRGGSFFQDSEQCNSFARFPSQEEWRHHDIQRPRSPWWLTTKPATGVGFRIVRQLTPATREEMEEVWKVDDPKTAIEVKSQVEINQRGSAGIADPSLHEAIEEIGN